MSDPIPAPELLGARDWLNVSAPLTLRELRGKVVLLDFWTYGCINCMHVLPDLKTLEQMFGDALVVVGIHSPKFPNERETANLRRVLARYEIEHPVANDADFAIWKAYGAQSWPTRVIIDPAGFVVGTAMGEGNLDGFVRAIGAVIGVFDERGEINRAKLPLQLERDGFADAPLSFPGKVLADPIGERLFISDSNHNRIVIASLDGEVIDVAGSGLPGDADGIFQQARFRRPQGLALDGAVLYVADTANHQVRAVDLERRVVETVVSDLRSPWDLARKTGILIVAMAGPHQLWVIDLVGGRAYPYAGNGQEARADGPVLEASFAQPSGLALDGDTLYVADAESNVIRAVSLPPVNAVKTLAGGDLFDFGDVDGAGPVVRLQHPLGVACVGEAVFVADTYNHRIKRLDPATGRVTAVAGSGRAGHADGRGTSAEFAEPGGISSAGRTLFVADTNNHAIRTIDLETFEVKTLHLKGLRSPAWSYLQRPV